MADGSSIPSPGGHVLLWALRNPQAVDEAIALLNRLQRLRIDLVAPGGDNRFPLRPADSPEGIVLGLPLKLPNAWAAPTGTVSRATFATSTATTAQLAQRLAALIQDLQATGQAPTTS
jgi:hypothetical protein